MRIGAQLVAFCLIAAACNGERRRLEEQLTVLQQRHALASRNITEHTKAMRRSEHQLDTLNAELTAYNTDVHHLLANHRAAAECIRTGRGAWGASNTFSNDASALTKVGIALCGVALLSREFAQEVAFVTKKLDEAETRVQSLKQQITAEQRAVESERSEVMRNETELDQVAMEIADIQRRLEK
ncbi:MAG TPA: hypothetical protein VEK79_14035 [Thermoanaerobaculia bacterium]|nr:hypothetical protein [Thermoanaerobaculia bacterium]